MGGGQVGERHTDAVFETLLSRIPHVQGMAAMPIVGQAQRLLFPSRLPEGPPPVHDPDRSGRPRHVQTVGITE
jgi:hypothetical protein